MARGTPPSLVDAAQCPPGLRAASARLAGGPGVKRVVVAQAGPWDVACGVAGVKGAERLSVYATGASEVVLGSACDPARNPLDGVPLRLSGPAERFVEGEADPHAGRLVALRWLGACYPLSVHAAAVARDLWANRDMYVDQAGARVRAVRGAAGGCEFTVGDVWRALNDWGDDPDALILVVPQSRVSKARVHAEFEVGWPYRAAKWGDADTVLLAERASGCRALVACVSAKRDVLEGWDAVAVEHRPSREPQGRSSYLLANRRTGLRHAGLGGGPKPPRRWPVFDDHEITRDSRVEFVSVDEHTVHYYRDLFVHKLGSTRAVSNWVLLIDGRVVSAMGLNPTEVLEGRSRWVWETFGITVTSARYARLGKLFMRLLTSGSFGDGLFGHMPSLGLRNPVGIRTTSVSPHVTTRNANRGILRLVSSEETPQGWRLVYEAEWRPDTYADCLDWWLSKFGHTHRQNYTCATCQQALTEGVG